MCGIVGYVGPRPTGELLLESLARLEYRGYDSAGLAIAQGGRLAVSKAAGKLDNLRSTLGREIPDGVSGIGHTRWATHGRPTDTNAHPHIDTDGHIAVIHNGIVENHQALRAELEARGHVFRSETDTEVLPHLLADLTSQGLSLREACRTLFDRVEGALALVILSDADPDTLVALRMGNAGGVVVGYGEGEMFIASDMTAILPYTRRVTFLDSMTMAVVTRDGATVLDRDGQPLDVRPEVMPYDPVSAARGGYKHFMLKEIMEQPETLTETLRSYADLRTGDVRLPHVTLDDSDLAQVGRIVVTGMGTSFYAAQIGRLMLEALTGLPAEADNASEFRYRNPVLAPDTLLVSITQSGETADTLAAMELARTRGIRQLTITNTPGSQSTRLADGSILLRCGPEQSVASTKCFTASLLALYLLALRIGEARGHLTRERVQQLVTELEHLPSQVSDALGLHGEIASLARTLHRRHNFLFLGRGVSYPVAMEGALKLKEVSYIHAEGYTAAEMKHGPIALLDENVPVVVIAPRDRLHAKTLGNIEESRARDARVYAVGTVGDAELASRVDAMLPVPPVTELLSPVVTVIPLQLLAYEIALLRGCDIDQPKNLAKSVTVE